MGIGRFSIESGLEKVADKICDLNNRYVFGINEDDLNPEVPLTTDCDWGKNRGAGVGYALIGIGMGVTAVVSGLFASYKIVDVVSHFGNLKAMSVDLGVEVLYLVSFGVSTKLLEKSILNIENLRKKRENKYNISEVV